MTDFKEVGLSASAVGMESSVSAGALADVDKLEDGSEAEFKGATLALAHEPPKPDNTSHPADATNGNATDNNFVPSNVRPSTVRPLGEAETRSFFAVRDGVLEQAAEQCQPVILGNLDGELRGVWLLTEIDHWDTEKERLLFLTEYSLLILKYDFITLRLLDYRRLPLKQFEKIVVGELKYPENSIMPSRNQIGVRCQWHCSQPLPFLKKWNPWSRDIPWITYTSHPLLKQKASDCRSNYDVEDFASKLVRAVESCRAGTASTPGNESGPDGRCDIAYEPVVIQNYAGLAAAIHNANDFGFFKARGKVSF